MTQYRTSFSRINFYYSPPLVQSADVVFDTDIPFEDDYLAEFEAVAWDAMWQQNPHWGTVGGWSSVMGDCKYVLAVRYNDEEN